MCSTVYVYTMQSKNDPILDAQQICAFKGPQTRQGLLDELKDLGWHETPADKAITVATGIYIVEKDGRFETMVNEAP